MLLIRQDERRRERELLSCYHIRPAFGVSYVSHTYLSIFEKLQDLKFENSSRIFLVRNRANSRQTRHEAGMNNKHHRHIYLS